MLLVTGFIVVAVLVRGGGPLPFDLSVTRAIQDVLGTGLGPLLGAAEAILAFVPLIIAIAIALFRRAWRSAGVIAAAMVAAYVVIGLIELALGRPRPDPSLVSVFERPSTSSGFPSVSVSGSVVFALLVTALARHARSGLANLVLGLTLGIALLTSLTVVYLGVHWASDVLGAWLIGGAFGLALAARLPAAATPRDP